MSLGEFDAALDLQGLFKSGFAVANVKAKEKLGYHWQREGSWLMSRPVAPDKTSIHVVDQYVDVARALGIPADRATWNLKADPVAQSKIKNLIDPAHPVVIVNGGAGWSTKRWDPRHFALVSDSLQERGAKTYFIGTEADRKNFEAIRLQCRLAPIDLLGKTSVKELVALISQADLHIGGDTGSTHIAAAWGIPCIGIYTLTRPERSCPYGQFAASLSTDPHQVREMAFQLLNEKNS
ncbi:MAG: glycosyltransferase family 9 protein [Fimbriimonadaceae bacterium]|nr:glycosyltransferase family 9 protein [Fimbriimonadaceae bacterium]